MHAAMASQREVHEAKKRGKDKVQMHADGL